MPDNTVILKIMVSVITHIFFLGSLISFSSFASVQATAESNQTSPLGINLGSVTYYSPEQPFLDAFKTGSLWYTQNSTTWDTREQSKLDVDVNGWVKSLSGVDRQAVNFTKLGILLLRELPAPYYPSGRYVVLYDGKGTLVYSFDAKKDTRASSPGRDVLNVTPSGAGILIQITATDPNQTGNYIRNIRLVRADQEALLQSGEVFNPTFLDRVKSFRVLRFMDWMRTNNSTQSAWSKRPAQSKGFYGDALGVPLEVMAALSNRLSADPWFNMPHMATDDYITQFATLTRALLTKDQLVYVEYSNETWNFIFNQATYMTNQGKARWPSSTKTDFEKNRSWFGMRTAQMCDIWKKVWETDAYRVICVMASQAANPWVSQASLNCPLWSGAPCSSNHGISALAIGPYFGARGVPSSWTSQPDGGLSYLFTEIMQGGLDPSGYPGGLIKQAIDWTVTQKSVANSYGLDLIAYEGGQHLVNPNDAGLTNLYVAANRDSRMGTAIATYLEKWRTAGGNLVSYFGDIGTYSKWGSWGALENVMNTGSPKYDALMDFVAANPRWWNDPPRYRPRPADRPGQP
jgi:hypothetical protein